VLDDVCPDFLERLVERAEDLWIDVALEAVPNEIGKLFVVRNAPKGLNGQHPIRARMFPHDGKRVAYDRCPACLQGLLEVHARKVVSDIIGIRRMERGTLA
jgi:hypothetical protein